MCPLYPLHFVLGYSLVLWVLWIVSGPRVTHALASSPLVTNVRLAYNGTQVHKIQLTERQIKQYQFYLAHEHPESVQKVLIQEVADDGLKHLDLGESTDFERYGVSDERNGTAITGQFNVSADLLGFSKIRFVVSNGSHEELTQIPTVNVEVHRGRRKLEIIFVHVIVILVLLAYVNMGCALDLQAVRATLRHPVGPVIGLSTQYIVMPLLSFTLGYALFRDTPEMWLGLFLTGCAPGGGGSNLWTYILKGSLDLSVTMTFISSLAAFGMLPLWVFALGRVIFPGGKFNRFPYRNMITLVLGLVVACGIGVGIRHCKPSLADFLKKLLKPVALVFIVFVMTFGVYVNLYMFSFFSWKVIVGSFCLPFFGYLFGGIAALALKQDWPSVTAISIETGIQNTGLAIGIIKVALQDFSPLDDLSMVMPVAVATMTPIPLAIAYIVQSIARRSKLSSQPLKHNFEFNDTHTQIL